MPRKKILAGWSALSSVCLVSAFALSPWPPAAQEIRTHADAPAGHLWHCGMHPQVIQDHPGDCPICHMALTPIGGGDSATAGAAERKVLYWWDPMLGPSSISDHPGRARWGWTWCRSTPMRPGRTVRIDPAVVQNMGVRTATVTRGPLNKTVRTVGHAQAPRAGHA